MRGRQRPRRAEAAGDFLLHREPAQVALGLVVVDRDRELSPSVARALADYRAAIYPNGLYGLPTETPIWTRLHGRTGRPLSARAISNVWKKRLGTSKVHSTRHTFAAAMEQVGAKVSVIQDRLGHSNLATTSQYLAALGSAENAFGEQLGALFSTA